MRTHSKYLISLLLFSLSQMTMAGDTLSGDKIKTLISGKTLSAEHIKGFKFKVYFDGKGHYVRNKDGNITEGTFTIKDSQHCVNVGGNDKCATIVDNGDGTYKRMKNGKKHFITWSNITAGKHL